MSMIISKKGKKAEIVERSPIEKEEYLQEYIHENPESIPIYEIKEERKLLVVAREYETNSGPIDALAIDKDGDIYIVETKLYNNTDKRRVVAQALDYGASLWRHSNNFDIFIDRIEMEIEKKFRMGFQDKAMKFFGLDEEGYNELLNGIRSNLLNGSLQFIVIMDSMDERLKDLIVYINQNSNFDIYAVELDHYKFEDFEIMLPRIFGVEVKKNMAVERKLSGRKKWGEESYFEQVEERLGSGADEHLKFYDFCKEISDVINWGTGKMNGSFTPVMKNIHPTIFPFSFYSGELVYVKVSWYVDRIDEKHVEEIKDLILSELNESGKEIIAGYDIYKDSIYLNVDDFEDRYESLKRIIRQFRSFEIDK